MPPAKNGVVEVTKAPFWHGDLRKDKWESLMNAGFYGPPGIAEGIASVMEKSACTIFLCPVALVEHCGNFHAALGGIDKSLGDRC